MAMPRAGKGAGVVTTGNMVVVAEAILAELVAMDRAS